MKFQLLATAAFLASVTEALPASQSASAIKCGITLDGRVPNNTPLSAFDTAASPFNPDNTKGQNLTFSKIILLPAVQPSKFDVPTNKALEATISDESIFVPAPGKEQVGFRRVGLLLGNGSDESNVGVKTFHWSVKQDSARLMNLTHEYLNVFHEANDFASNQFSFGAGTLLNADQQIAANVSAADLDKNLWKFLDRKNNIISTTAISVDEWQNFAITLDYVKNTVQIFSSLGNAPLCAVTGLIANDNSGGGQFQIGMAKKPTETKTVVFDGFQEANLDEGLIYGGIFIEDSAGGCVSK